MHREVPSPPIIIYESIYPMDKLKKTHQLWNVAHYRYF